MAAVANLQFQLVPGSLNQEPVAELSFDVLFTPDEVSANTGQVLEVLLDTEQSPGFSPAYANAWADPKRGGIHLAMPPYHLWVACKPTGPSPDKGVYRGLDKKTTLASAPADYPNGNGSYVKSPAATGNGLVRPSAPELRPLFGANGASPAAEAQPETSAPSAADGLFRFRKTITPEGRSVLTFRRRVVLPLELLPDAKGAFKLVTDEHLVVLQGAEALTTWLGSPRKLGNRAFKLPEILTTESGQRVVECLTDLWRTRERRNLVLDFWHPDQKPRRLVADLVYNDKRSLEPEIHIQLRQPGTDAQGGVLSVIEALYQQAPYGAVLLDTARTVVWHNPALLALLGLPGREPILGLTAEELLARSVTDRTQLLALQQHSRRGLPDAVELHVAGPSGETKLRLTSRTFQPEGGESLALWLFEDQTEVLRMAVQLKATEQKLLQMVNAAPIGICVTNEHGIFEQVNEAYGQIYGFQVHELQGKHFSVVVPKHQEGLWRKTHDNFIQGKEHTRGEFQVQDRYGRPLTVLADSARTVGADGKTRKITFVIDITERRRSEEQLRGSEERLMRVFESAPIGICITDPSGAFEVVNQAYCGIYGYTPDELLGQPFTKIVPPEHTHLWQQTHEKFLAGRTETRGEFTVRHKLGHDLVVLADSVRITGSDGQPRKVTFVLDITERKRTERATEEARAEMERSEQRVRQIIQQAPIGICITSPSGTFETVNQAYCHIYGYHPEDLLGKPFTMVVPKNKADWWLRKHELFLQGQDETRGEFQVVDSKGRLLTVMADSTRIQGPDGQPRKVTFVLDITERKAQEAQLKKSEERLATLIESAPIGICVTGHDYRLRSVNEAYCGIYGYTPEELIGQPFTKIVPPSSASHWQKTHDQFLEGKTHTRGEFEVVGKDGRRIIVLADSARITGADGEPLKVTFVLDITERKAQEAQLKKSEERLATLIESAPIGICVTGHDYRLRSVNEAYCRTYGYTPEELIGQPFTKIVPPSSASHWQKTHDQFLEGKTHTRGEFEVVGKDGRRIIVLADSARITGADGEPLKVTFVLDITERKAQEAQLKKSEERLMTLIESAPIGICVTGDDYRLRSVNEAYCRIYGYTPEELIGQPFTKIVPPSSASHWQKTHDQFLEGKTHTRGEFEVVGKDGRRIIVMADSARITGSDGQPLKVTFVVDITERKKSELAILEANESLQRAKAELEANNHELEANRATLQANFQQLDESKRQLEAYTTELEANRQRLQAAVVEVEAKNAELEKNRQALEASYHEISSSKAQLEANNRELEQNRKQLEESLRQLETSNLELEQNRLQLQESYAKLEANNEELEQNRKKVEAANKKLEASNAELEANRRQLEKNFQQLELNQSKLKESNAKLENTLAELSAMQGQLVVSEKMAALGQLIAGVAHEVNTPISAVKASVRNMMRDLPEALDGLPKLLAAIPKAQVGVLREFLTATIGSHHALTTKEERQYRQQIEDTLNEHGVEQADEIANTLVEIRVIENVSKYLPLFSGKYTQEILELAYKLGQLKVNLGNIDLASDKTNSIVKALKNYSYVQSSDRLVPSDIVRSVEDILTLLHNQLKYGIELEQNYDDELPLVPIYPDELGQVWTNIINNAVQAMGGNGKLQVGIHRAGEFVEVAITDNGPGIPKEIRDRIFEPFFTTKPQGEGTGLGLDISRKIIEKHQGQIQVESQPGETTFIVRLPIEPRVGKELLDDIPAINH